MWDDYKALPETQFFLHWWWVQLLFIAAVLVVVRTWTR